MPAGEGVRFADSEMTIPVLPPLKKETDKKTNKESKAPQQVLGD